jgi:hypothetical protein
VSAAAIAPRARRASRSLRAGALVVALALGTLLGGASPSVSAKGKKHGPAATGVAKSRAPRSRAAPRTATRTATVHVAPAPTPTSIAPSAPDPAPSPAPSPSDPRADDAPSVPATSTTRTARTKVYSFGAMDVEGKLKTPQLLYFLNRVKLELDMSAPDRRSFMKELARTADDPNL